MICLLTLCLHLWHLDVRGKSKPEYSIMGIGRLNEIFFKEPASVENIRLKTANLPTSDPKPLNNEATK